MILVVVKMVFENKLLVVVLLDSQQLLAMYNVLCLGIPLRIVGMLDRCL